MIKHSCPRGEASHLSHCSPWSRPLRSPVSPAGSSPGIFLRSLCVGISTHSWTMLNSLNFLYALFEHVVFSQFLMRIYAPFFSKPRLLSHWSEASNLTSSNQHTRTVANGRVAYHKRSCYTMLHKRLRQSYVNMDTFQSRVPCCAWKASLSISKSACKASTLCESLLLHVACEFV